MLFNVGFRFSGGLQFPVLNSGVVDTLCLFSFGWAKFIPYFLLAHVLVGSCNDFCWRGYHWRFIWQGEQVPRFFYAIYHSHTGYEKKYKKMSFVDFLCLI